MMLASSSWEVSQRFDLLTTMPPRFPHHRHPSGRLNTHTAGGLYQRSSGQQCMVSKHTATIIALLSL